MIPYVKAFFDFVLFFSSAVFLCIGPFSTFAVRMCFSVMSFAWFMANVLRYKLKFYRGLFVPNPMTGFLSIFAGTLILATLCSTNFYLSQRIVFDRYIMFFTFFYMGAWLVFFLKKYFLALMAALMLVGTLFGIGGIRDYFYYSYTAPALAERLWSIFGIRIPYYALPLYLVFFIPFNFFICVYGKNKFVRIFALLNTLMLSACLLWTSSRIAWVAVLFTVVPSLALKNIGKKFKALALLLTFLLICGAFIFPHTRQRILTIPVPQEWSNRLPLYKSACKIFLDYPIFGAGVGTFEKILHTPKYELPPDYPVAKELNLHAHNTYLEIAAETGIVGLAGFCLLFAAFFYQAISLIGQGRLSNTDSAIFSGLSASVFSMLLFAFGTTIIIVGPTVSAYFWFLFGMAAGFLTTHKKESQNNTPA